MGIISKFKQFRNKQQQAESNGHDNLEGSKQEKEMSFLEHLEELRWHLLRSLASILIFGIVIFLFIDYVTDEIIFYTFEPDFPLHRWLCSLRPSLCFEKMPVEFINTKPYEQFLKSITISFVGGFILAFPYFIWEMWRFIKPGLHPYERKYLRGTVFSSSLLFFAGVLFAYYIVVPFAAQFLATYQISTQVENKWTFQAVIGMVTRLVLAGGIMFELPIVVYFLSKVGIATPEGMRKYRRHAIVVLLILSAIITPPDVMSQILIFIPLFLLYQLSIWISAVVNKKREEELGMTETSTEVDKTQ